MEALKEAIKEELDEVMVTKVIQEQFHSEFKDFLAEWNYRLGLFEAGLTDTQRKLDQLRERFEPGFRQQRRNLNNFMTTLEPDNDLYG
jgi:hypothetical protein